MDSERFICGVFVYLNKPFDTIDHPSYYYKFLRYSGVKGVAQAWIKNNYYLTNNAFIMKEKRQICE